MEGKGRQEPQRSKNEAGGENGETLWKYLMKNNRHIRMNNQEASEVGQIIEKLTIHDSDF